MRAGSVWGSLAELTDRARLAAPRDLKGVRAQDICRHWLSKQRAARITSAYVDPKTGNATLRSYHHVWSTMSPDRTSLTDYPTNARKRPPGRDLQALSAEPGVDSLGDRSPTSFEHHVVTHVGEEFRFGTVCACRCVYFFRGDRAVIVGPEDQQRRGHTFRPGQVEQTVDAGAGALFLEPRRVVQDFGVRQCARRRIFPVRAGAC